MFLMIDDLTTSATMGELVAPAQMVTPDAVNFMALHARGLIRLALTKARATQLGLEMMAPVENRETGYAFTMSIEARDGVTTGISAADRARTIRVAVDPIHGPAALVSPGHIFPVVARDGGVLVRAGSAEAATDLARLAGLMPAAVICQVMNDDGALARPEELRAFARAHGLKIGTIADLIRFRRPSGRAPIRGRVQVDLRRRLAHRHVPQHDRRQRMLCAS